MAFNLANLSDLGAHGFDEIVDVRSPIEYAEDHLPGALNLPVLSDAERARVGTIYKQESPFAARKLGAALIARNAAAHLEGHFVDKPGSYQPLLYCWRGGQRSGALAIILRQIGWRVELLDGGYKSYRRAVVAALYDAPLDARLILLDGNTGTAKTEILHQLGARGVQVLDLEGLAGHRGSVFGAQAGGQPSQKAFESGIAHVLAGLDLVRPLIVEAESSRIGTLTLPPALWAAMSAAPRIRLEADLDQRADYLARTYSDLAADRAHLTLMIGKLSPYHAGDVIEDWMTLARRGDYARLAAGLMARHYDPKYARQRARCERDQDRRVRLASLDPDGLSTTVDRLAGLLSGSS